MMKQYPWIATLSAALFFFVEFILMQMGGTLQLHLMHDFNLLTTQFSLLIATFLYGNTIFLIPAGMLLDRYSIKHIMTCVIFFAAMSTAVFALTTHFYLAVLCRFIQGGTNAFCFLSCVLIVAQNFPAHQRGLVMGLIVTVAMCGGLVAQTPLALLTSILGWRHVLLLVAILIAFNLLLFYLFVEDNRSFNTRIQLKEEKAALFQVCRDLANWYYGLYIALMNLPIMVISALWGTVFLQTLYQLTLKQASFVNSFILFGTMIGSPLLGSLSDQFKNRQTVMAYSAVLSFLILAAILFSNISNVPYLSLMFFILGIASSAQVIGYPLIAENNSKDLQAKATSIASMMIMGIAALSQTLTGYLLESWQRSGQLMVNHFSVQSFQFTFGIMLVGFLLSGMICCYDVFLLRKKGR